MLNAKMKYSRFLRAGTSITFTLSDFDYFDGNTVKYPVSLLGFRVVPDGGSDEGYLCYTNLPTGSTNSQVTVTAFKHLNSTSKADDLANGHPNSSSDDVAVSNWSIGCEIVDSNGDIYFAIIKGTYYAGIWPPNISFTRLNQVLGINNYTLSGICQSANINKYSYNKSDRVVPHGIGEFIGYNHSIDGNARIVKFDDTYVIIGKMSVLDDDTDIAKFKIKIFADSSPTPTIIRTIDLTGATVYSVTETVDLLSQVPEGSTVVWSAKLYRTTTSSVEHLIDTETLSMYKPYPKIDNLNAYSNYPGDYTDKTVYTIRLTYNSLETSGTYKVHVAYIYMNKYTGQTFRVPTSGYVAILDGGLPKTFQLVDGKSPNVQDVNVIYTVPSEDDVILGVTGYIELWTNDQFLFTATMSNNLPYPDQ